MSSKLARPLSAPAISSASGATLPASLRTGTTTEMAGSSRVSGVVSGMKGWSGRGSGRYRPRVLLAEKPPGNRLDAPPRWARQRAHGSSLVNGKAEPPRREPVAHQNGAEGADERGGDHVAREMRLDDDAADRDDDREGPH